MVKPAITSLACSLLTCLQRLPMTTPSSHSKSSLSDTAGRWTSAYGPATEFGIFPQLAALETIVYPTSAQLIANNALASSGTLEIVPTETPLTLFVWSKSRVLPVRLTTFAVTEQAFDPALNPIRATVNLGMRVLTVDDLPFSHKGASLFLNYLQTKERLAARTTGLLNTLGIGGIP